MPRSWQWSRTSCTCASTRASCRTGPANAAERTKADDDPFRPPFELPLLDVATGARRVIREPGSRHLGVALSSSGDVIATSDSAGTIRVGRADGSEPHLLPGSGGGGLAFSPDGRWLASVPGGEIRLWPVPDLTKPPLHTLPREALIARLGSLTNVRVVADKARRPLQARPSLLPRREGHARLVRPWAAQEAAGSKGLR